MHAEEEDLVEVISNASEPMTEETEAPTTPRVFVQNVQPRSSKRGPCRPHGVLRLPWFRRFRRLSERSRSQSSTECAEKAQTLQTQQTQWAQGLAMPLWQTMLAGGLACVFHRAVAGSIEDMMRGRQASVAQNILKFSKGGFPFGALCCSFYVAASMNFSSFQGCVDAAWNAPSCKTKVAGLPKYCFWSPDSPSYCVFRRCWLMLLTSWFHCHVEFLHSNIMIHWSKEV